MRHRYRRNYLTYPYSQFKFVFLGVVPVLVMSLFCAFLVARTGRAALKAEKDKLLLQVTSLSGLIYNLEREDYPEEIVTKVRGLKKELISTERILKTTFFDTMKEWKRTKNLIGVVLIISLVVAAVTAVFYSHRVVGPLHRLKRYMDLLAEGKRIPVVRFRKYDECGDLADSLEKLRESLEEKGFLS